MRKQSAILFAAKLTIGGPSPLYGGLAFAQGAIHVPTGRVFYL